jgi:hypothetical protein
MLTNASSWEITSFAWDVGFGLTVGVVHALVCLVFVFMVAAVLTKGVEKLIDKLT